jgi:hypothetical protein
MGTKAIGSQARGHAGVFNQTPDFWRYVQVNQNKQAQRQSVLDNERKLRDDTVREAMKFSPEKVWEPFYAEVEDYIQTNIRDFVFEARDKGIPMSRIQPELARRQGVARKMENKSLHFKDIHKQMFDRIETEEKQGFFKRGYYDSKLNDFFFNGRQSNFLDNINPDGIENIFNDSKGYNLSAIASDFVGKLATQMTEKYRKVASDLGEQFDVNTVKTKLGVMMKPDGTPDLDPITGQPKIQMTDDVTMMAMENQYLRNYVTDQLGRVPTPNDKEKVKDLLAPFLAPFDPRSVQNKRQQGRTYTADDKANRSGYTVPEKVISERYDTLHRITHEHDPELLASLLPGLEDVNIGYEVYGPGESKKAPPRIVLTFPNKKRTSVDTDEPKMLRKVLSLETEEDRQAAMEVLNTLMDDKLDAKQRIGENFTNYRKRKRKEMSDQGGVYEDTNAVPSSDTGGVYDP